MKFPSTTAVLALVLALAVVSASAKDNNNNTYPAPLGRKQRRASQKTGLRRGGRRAQGAQQRAIICDAQGELSFVMVRGSARFVRGKSNYCPPPKHACMHAISVRALFLSFPPNQVNSYIFHFYLSKFIHANLFSSIPFPGGVGQSGQVGTAPAYDACYLSGCDRQAFGCRSSSECAPGACCMPTNIYGEFHSIEVIKWDVIFLYFLIPSKYSAQNLYPMHVFPTCKC